MTLVSNIIIHGDVFIGTRCDSFVSVCGIKITQNRGEKLRR